MVSQQLNRTAVIALIAITVIYFIVRTFAAKAVETLDNAAKDATKPAGDLLSDITAVINGHKPVELTPLVIQEHHLNWDYTLTQEAERVFWKIGEYQPLLYKLFGTKGRAMKVQYRHLVGRPITEETI